MKPARFSKFAFLPLLVAAIAVALTGCGGTNNLTLTQGNWSVKGASSQNGTFYIGGNLAQAGHNLAGTMYISGSPCFDISQGIAFTGTVQGNKVTLVSASVGGQVITVNATGTAAPSGSTASSFSGTYTLTGGSCANGDTGTAAANAVASISGTWNGPIINDAFGDPNVTLAMNLTQASAPSAGGTFAVTGTVTYTGSSCSVSGTLTNSFIFGQSLVISANTVEKDASAGSFSYAVGLLDVAAAPQSFAGGTYDVSSGLCQGDLETPTFTKQ